MILPMLPALAPDRITPLADDLRSTVRTTALFALAHLDTAAGVPTLIAALQDARARIAIHAVRSSLRQMPVTEALTLLRGVPFGRVTVAKEVVRLVSELDAPEAWEQLVAYSQQDLHRDVRVALIQSLDRHLNRAHAWEILEENTRNPDPVIAQASLALPTFAASSFADQSSHETQLHVFRPVASLLEHPAREARDACRSYCAQLGVADDAHMLTPQLVSGILAGTYADATTEQQEEAINTIGAFFGVCSASDTEATADLMRALTPHRVALTVAVDALDDAPRFEQRRLLPVLRAAVAALVYDQLTIIKRMQLALEHLPQTELAQFLLGLSGQPALHANALYHAAEMLQTQAKRFSADELEALEQSLASSDDAAMRWLAYNALLMREKKEGGWADALLARLSVYRNDPDPLVASDAQFNLSDPQTF